MPTRLQQICNQLIEESDLEISGSTQKHLATEGIAVELRQNPPVVKIFCNQKLTLSDVIPIIHDFGFVIVNEISFLLKAQSKEVYVTKLYLDVAHPSLLEKHAKHITEILLYALQNPKKESCALFALSYLENFCMHSVLLFRTIVHYENQLVPEFNIPKILQTLIRYHSLSNLFYAYFSVKFDPAGKGRKKQLQGLHKEIERGFKKVRESDDDRILKLFFKILHHMLRTNYYLEKPSIAIKIDVEALKPHLRGVQPMIEAYVYNETFRGTHMRMGKVARGGIRYSSRPDDYRVEIKSLMAAQEGKNAIIIPSGAKGGFIIDTPRYALSFELFTDYYSAFIDALLDLVDNKIDDHVVHDTSVVAYDDDDTYFVVAADRGTSNMSDTANAIAQKRGFWIDDAFASGGSNGFHHKKLGITAKGALKSVERFFIERGINFYEKPITVVGIGSMSGDVFGNGLLQSKTFKLLGAISHDEVFIDPDPDPGVAYEERLRLFGAQHQKWSDYNPEKISEGGGVYKRSNREIELNEILKKMLHTRKETVNGEELANMLLKLPVDMLYNGGVGTYVKSSEESNLEVGDKENEYVRVDATEVRAFCFCEGGNLGMTQKARYEYARNGGKVHLDSIDNAAGVNTSDHEVNFKIILNALVQKAFITPQKKRETLMEQIPFVVNSVLWTNYFQALCIALDRKRSREKSKEFIRVVNLLENHLDVFKRRYFNLPKDTDFVEVIDRKGYIIRPALSVILLYAKIFLKKILNESDLYKESAFFQKYLFKYFPKEFIALYEDAVLSHPLKKEIISMIIANKIIDQFGATFLSDYEEIGHEKFLLKIKAYLITNQLYSANDVRYNIYRGDYSMPVQKQYDMLLEIEDQIAYNVRWMLRALKPEEFCFETILDYKEAINTITANLDIPKRLLIPEHSLINDFFTRIDYLKFATAIIRITKQTGAPFKRCAMLFYYILQTFEITLLIEHIETVTINKPNEALLQEQLQILLEALLVDLTTSLLAYQRSGESIENTLENYLREKEFDFKRYKKMLDYLKKNENATISDLSVIVNHFLLIRT
ncbi:MAG TPA: glutamate dehydrogenase [Campylobacteraceae bacterium]|nr:glutamate dehydrogenase [Campylobacteraceae bacterium]